MKTAVSLPDPLFRAGERVAKRLRISRSELYARALAEFVNEKNAGDVTQRLNAVYAGQPSAIDPRLVELQADALDPEAW